MTDGGQSALRRSATTITQAGCRLGIGFGAVALWDESRHKTTLAWIDPTVLV
ncbi:MAG: hypothetical protein ABSE59_08085 [Opitutaceae bacterium]